MNRYDRVLMVVSIIFRRFVNAAHGKIMVSLKVFFPMWKFEKKSFTIYLILIFINLFQGIPAKENI